MNTQEVKDLLGIEHDEYNDKIRALIPSVTDYIYNYCNVTELNPSLKLALALIINHNITYNKSGIKSESVGDASITYNTEYPDNIMKILKSNRYALFI